MGGTAVELSHLRVDGLSVFYGEIQALWGVSFEVKRGGITALVGSNGAGKTTLLYTIAGLLRQNEGRIIFDGEDISTLPAYERVQKGICLVPEGRRLFPQLTVQENLELGGYSPKARRDIKETLSLAFEFFPKLREYRSRPAGTLSGGEQQMLAIARGLMTKPSLLMLDEPSLGLAPVIVMRLFDFIRQINETGVTILLVEQNVRQTLQISREAFVLETGRVVMRGGGEELLESEAVKTAYLGN